MFIILLLDLVAIKIKLKLKKIKKKNQKNWLKTGKYFYDKIKLPQDINFKNIKKK